MQQRGSPHPGECLRPCPLTKYQLHLDRNVAQMKEQSITSNLSDEEIANLSGGEFKAVVIKMLTDLIELGQKMKNK